MKAFSASFVFVSVMTLVGCGTASGGSGDLPAGDQVGTAQAEITLLDCQKQVASCTLSAKSFFDLGKCTTAFQGCTVQAAADLTGQSKLLQGCRDSANKCLTGAVTLTDIKACRTVYDACAADLQTTATDALKTAVDAAKSSIDKAGQVALDTINAAGDAVGGALDALSVCEAQADKCLSSALTSGDVSACRDAFETCADKAVSLVDEVVAPLPGPTPTELIDGMSACQDAATDCLSKAVTDLQISACKGTLSTCVDGATALVDQTTGDLTGLLPLPLPPLTAPVDCSAQAAECLLSLTNPTTCADQAAKCLGL